MSKFLLKDKDGSFRKIIDDPNKCKYMINGICCNEESKKYGTFPMIGPFTEQKCNNRRGCKLYEGEYKLKIKMGGKRR